MLHTSSDGQKFEVKVESLNANHSFKYFGKGKGVSVYSFIDERHLLFHSTVISAAEWESAYVIDDLMHNDVVKSDVHSTDTHGWNIPKIEINEEDLPAIIEEYLLGTAILNLTKLK